jgi:hypothetical protein
MKVKRIVSNDYDEALRDATPRQKRALELIDREEYHHVCSAFSPCVPLAYMYSYKLSTGLSKPYIEVCNKLSKLGWSRSEGLVGGSSRHVWDILAREISLGQGAHELAAFHRAAEPVPYSCVLDYDNMRFTHSYHAGKITQLHDLSEKGLDGCHVVILRAFESAHVAVIHEGEIYDLSSAPLTSEVLTTIKVS